MRVILIGPAAARARLRAQVNGAFTLVGEFEDAGAARASGVDADAFVVAADRVTGPHDADAAALPVEPLTEREVEVLELLAEGLPNKAIAVRLGISDQTVKFHAASIMGKLGAHNRTEAVRIAVRRGLLAL